MNDNVMIKVKTNKIGPDISDMPIHAHPPKNVDELLGRSAILDGHYANPGGV